MKRLKIIYKKIKYKLSLQVSAIKDLAKKYIEDFFIITGLILINIPFYLWNYKIGIFITGLIFLIIGIYFSFNLPWKEK